MNSGRLPFVLGARARHAVRDVLAKLRGPVGHIFFLRSEKQVLGIDACRYVASVADGQACRDGAVHRRPGCPVRIHRPTIDAEVAISIAVGTARPQDAAGCWIMKATVIETLLERLVRWAIEARHGHEYVGSTRILRALVAQHLFWALAFCVLEQCSPIRPGPLPIVASAKRTLSTGIPLPMRFANLLVAAIPRRKKHGSALYWTNDEPTDTAVNPAGSGRRQRSSTAAPVMPVIAIS